MSKNGKAVLVPKIRFSEFTSTGEWDKFTLRKLSERIIEKVGGRKLTTLSISAGVGFVSQAEKFSRDISGKQYQNYIYLRKGDFSYNKGNSKKFPQGCIYQLKEYEEAAVPNAFISFHFRDNYVSNFFKGYFDNNFHGKQLTRFITSGARSDGLLNINPSDFFSIILPTPKDNKEQQKIADCLSSIDDLIIAEDKKLALLKDHKKGLMQKLFPVEGETLPELRFSEFKNHPEWSLDELGNLTLPVKERTGTKKYTLMSVTSGVGLVTQIEKFGKEIAGNSYKNYYVIKKNDFAYNKSATKQFPEGYISMLVDYEEAALPNSIFTCFRIIDKECYPKFFDHLFHLNYHGSWLRKFISIGARAHGALNIDTKHLWDMPVPIPRLKEQQKIADCLSSLDELIATQTEKIEALKSHKRGLMQGLFPSIDEVDE